MSTDKLLIGRKEAAQKLSVSCPTLDRLVKNGNLTANRVGRRVLFSQWSLDTFTRRTQVIQ
jgi:excisionase family DNA binding protein